MKNPGRFGAAKRVAIVLLVAGCAAVIYGVALWSHALAWVLGGLGVILLAILFAEAAEEIKTGAPHDAD